MKFDDLKLNKYGNVSLYKYGEPDKCVEDGVLVLKRWRKRLEKNNCKYVEAVYGFRKWRGSYKPKTCFIVKKDENFDKFIFPLSVSGKRVFVFPN